MSRATWSVAEYLAQQALATPTEGKGDETGILAGVHSWRVARVDRSGRSQALNLFLDLDAFTLSLDAEAVAITAAPDGAPAALSPPRAKPPLLRVGIAAVTSIAKSPHQHEARLLLRFTEGQQTKSLDLLFSDGLEKSRFMGLLLTVSPGIDIRTSESRDTVVAWAPDTVSTACTRCGKAFTVLIRKHHCRACGALVCGSCSSHTAVLTEGAHRGKAVRVCDGCFAEICDARAVTLAAPDSPGQLLRAASSVASLLPSTPTSAPSSASPSPSPSAASPASPSLPRSLTCLGAAGASATSIPGVAAGSRPFASPATHALGLGLALRQQQQQHARTISGGQHPRSLSGGRTLSSGSAVSLHTPSELLPALSAPSPPTSPSHSAAASLASSLSFSPSSSASASALTSASAPAAAAPGSPPSPSPGPGRDIYGFSVTGSSQRGWDTTGADFALELERRRRAWASYLAVRPATAMELERCPELKRLVRGGVPPELRGRVWQSLCGTRIKAARFPADHYASLVERAAASPLLQDHDGNDKNSTATALSEISRDLHRTFPSHALYETDEGLSLLKRVLSAYSLHNPHVGYCQSMNFIAGLLVLFMEEEEAFWMLSCIVEDLLCLDEENPVNSPFTHKHPAPTSAAAAANGSGGDEARTGTGAGGPTEPPDQPLVYHQSDLAGAHVDQAVFRALLADKLPKVVAHFDSFMLPIETVTINWFLCLFATTLPPEAAFRLWDCVFYEGVKVLFRAGLALVKIHEKAILATTAVDQLLTLVKSINLNAASAHAFFKTCFDKLFMGSFPMSKISRLRAQHRAAVLHELRQARIDTERREEAYRKEKEERERRKRLQKEKEKEKERAAGVAAAAAAEEGAAAVAASPSASLALIEDYFPRAHQEEGEGEGEGASAAAVGADGDGKDDTPSDAGAGVESVARSPVADPSDSCAAGPAESEPAAAQAEEAER